MHGTVEVGAASATVLQSQGKKEKKKGILKQKKGY